MTEIRIKCEEKTMQLNIRETDKIMSKCVRVKYKIWNVII